ncbi:creatininase family protein [Caldalkalibacillus salinus]|uniref:creatininase family protein n=1 Tax=Caldalkalibacillus salinus TaxID=2803787 RepID=UPI001923F75B|nr:creatininase family protein [Caldalkalibacillus salinus]
MRFDTATSYTIKEKIKDSQIALLPIGAVEAHGPHLPLGTDNILAEKLAATVAEKTGALQLPLLPFGQVWSLKNFPGSIHVSNESLVSMLVDIGESLYRQGIRILAFINGHLGNANALKEASRQLFERYSDFKVFAFFYPGTKKLMDEIRDTTSSHSTYFHACEIETSLMLYVAEEEVDMSKALNENPIIPESADVTPTPWETFTDTAVLGDATRATKKKGAIIVEQAISKMVELLEEARDKVKSR